ncbi:MAG: hypothetical protein R3B96_03115 [Pirellulaceae bacterium]
MHRVSLFLSQHLVLVIASGELFNNMHEAYHHIGRVDSPFGGFISGPSKTADIEQSLVIGRMGRGVSTSCSSTDRPRRRCGPKRASPSSESRLEPKETRSA